jgi:hypothetical protein
MLTRTSRTLVALALLGLPATASARALAWQNMGGPFNTSFAPAVAHVAGTPVQKVTAYAVDTNGATTAFQIDVTGEHVDLVTSLGGFTNAAPAAVEWPNHKEVIVLGGDGNLYHRVSTDGGISYSGWSSIGKPPSTTICSAPSAVSWGPGRVDVLVTGCDTRLWMLTELNNGLNWANRGNTNLVGRPTAVSPAGARLDIWVRDTAGRLWDDQYNGSTWTWRDAGVTPVNASMADSVPTWWAQTKSAFSIGVQSIPQNPQTDTFVVTLGDVFTDHPFVHPPTISVAKGTTLGAVTTRDSNDVMIYYREQNSLMRQWLNWGTSPLIMNWQPVQNLGAYLTPVAAITAPVDASTNKIFLFAFNTYNGNGELWFARDTSDL